MPFMLHAADFWLEKPRRIVIAGDPNHAKMRELLRAVHSVYQPNKIVLGNAGPVEPLPGLCLRKAARWFIFASATRASCRRVNLKK